MWIVRALLCATTLTVAGCAAAPSPERGYAAVTRDVTLASTGTAPAGPATLPLEPELSGRHNEDFYLQIALERNPLILAARREVAAIVETIPQQAALADPMLRENVWPAANHSPQTAAGRMANSLSVSQQMPWPDKLRVRAEVAEQEAKMALARLAAEELATTERLRVTYYDLYYYERAIAVTRENRDLLDRLVGFAEARYRTGGSQQDVIRVEVERDRLDNQIIEYEQRLSQAQADLAALVHASPEIQPLAAETLSLPAVPETLDRLYELSARCRPELRERLSAIVRDQRKRELARLAYVPDLTAGFGWDLMTKNQALSPVANGHDNLGIQLGINLPIYRDKLQAGVREAEHRVVESARRYDAERDETFRQIRRLAATAGASERQIALYRDRIVPNTQKALDVSIADYTTGRGDILQVISNYTELLTFEIQVARYEADLGQALASLERVVGCEIASSAPIGSPEAPPAPQPLPEPATEPVPEPVSQPVSSLPAMNPFDVEAAPSNLPQVKSGLSAENTRCDDS